MTGRSVGAMPLGPLVGPECRRASGRGWLFLARAAAGLAASAVALAILWWWWINWNEGVDPGFSPFGMLRGGLAALVGLGATIGLVFGPAVVAGSLAGEQERGSMGLLLTTRVNSLEIVAGRLAGRLAQVGMVLLAAVPPTLLLAALAGIRPGALLAMLGYGPALAAGASGLTAGVAVLSRRGRDALLGAYAIGLGLVLAPMLVGLAAPGAADALSGLNPYRAIGPLALREEAGPAWSAMAWWLGIGAIGAAVAVNRLRPNSLRWLDGDPGRSRRGSWRFRRRVGPIGARPMLWKEIYIERRSSLGGLGRWLGYLAVAYLTLASTLLAALCFDDLLRLKDLERASAGLVRFQSAIVDTSTFFGIFIQWAVGLRAAVAIASERERGTWDALLTSPLEGGEIVAGKLLGSLHALRWLILATVYAWSLALGIGAMSPWEYGAALAWTVVLTAFMAAVGVRTSLGTEAVPTAMAVTIGVWLAALAALSLGALILVGLGALAFLVAWLFAEHYGLTTRAAPWFPIGGDEAFLAVQLGLFAIATALVVAESRARFDRLAGRIVPGDAWVEGAPASTGAEAGSDAVPDPGAAVHAETAGPDTP